MQKNFMIYGVFLFTLLCSLLTVYLSPDLSDFPLVLTLLAPLLGAVIDLFSGRKKEEKTYLISFSTLPIYLLLILFILSGITARSEFQHFETKHLTDNPLSYILLFLTVLIALFKHRGSIVKSYLSRISFGIWSIVGFFLLYSVFTNYQESWSILPVTYLSLYLSVASLFFMKLDIGEIKTGLLVSLFGVLLSLVLVIDAAKLLRDKPACGEPSYKPSEKLLSYLLTAEDPRFYLHNGIDLHRLRMAVREALLKKKLGRGGSTLTMQYTKVCYLSYEKTLFRKVRQGVTALLLELTMSKDETLSRYLTSIPYGDNLFGIEAASKHYYSKPSAQLKDNEALALVLTIFSPSEYNPHKKLSIEEMARRAVIKTRSKTHIILDDRR